MSRKNIKGNKVNIEMDLSSPKDAAVKVREFDLGKIEKEGG